MDLKTGAVGGGGVRTAFRSTDQAVGGGIDAAIKLSLPIDTATGKRATVDTPPDRIEIIEVDPRDVGNYLEGTG